MDTNKTMVTLAEAVEQIKTAILQSQYEALKDVNRVQLALYFSIGKYLSENTRRGVWGTGVLKQISEQLRKELPGLRGFSETSLKNMRLFYDNWQMLDNKPIIKSSVATDDLKSDKSAIESEGLAVAKNVIDIHNALTIPNITEFPAEDFLSVPFTHHITLIALCKNLDAKYYYLRRTAKEKLSVSNLETLIKSQAYEHHENLPNNFAKTIPNSNLARKAVMMFKDSYALDFINTEEIGERNISDIDERVVEQQIVHNIKKFIMTFGNDFAFIGNQYHLEIYGEEFFPDLLFFNRELNAMVVVELKMGNFKPSYLGQLTAYLQILDDKVRKPHENPSIGIVLCKTANKEYVEYVIQKYDSPMGVATYTTAKDMPENLRRALPDIEQLKKVLSGK